MKRDSRPEVKLITKQWVRENCRNITDRDLGLIKVVYQRKLLRRDQLEMLYPYFTSTDFLNKRLARLYKQHIIDRIYPPVGLGEGSSKQHICLDRAGAILIGIDKYNKPVSTDSLGNKTLPMGWEHRIALNDYECSIRSTVNLIGAEIKLYQVERQHTYGDTKLIPDIFCLIKHNGKGFPFFIEVDLGTEDIPYLKRKIDSYHNYFLSREWLREPWTQLFKTPFFPRVLILTEDGRNRRQITLQDYTKDLLIHFVVGQHGNFRQILRDIMKGSH